MKKLKLLIICTLFTGTVAQSQQLVEATAAIVGNEVIYLSDIETAVAERRRSERTPVEELRCQIFNDMLIMKLYIDQARIDSIEVSDDGLESQINMRINDVIRQVGSEEALVEYFKKSMIEIRQDIRRALREQQVASEVQSTISENISITPSDVRRFFNNLPKDSIIPAKYQLSIIQLDPPSFDDNKAEARQRLLDIRSQIVEGANFGVQARLYSEEPGAATTGGEIGYMARYELDKDYANVAFSLTNNTVSRIVESQFGFHIIQLIDRKGDLVNTRHILIRPQVKPEQTQKAISKLDSIADLIRRDSIKFEDAARRFSSHQDSRINGGKLVYINPNSLRISSLIAPEELNRDMYNIVRNLKIGEISEPFRTEDEKGNPVFRIIKIDGEVPAHTANLKDDYEILYEYAMFEKRQKLYEDWIKKKIERTYIKIGEEFKSCGFLQQEGWLK